MGAALAASAAAGASAAVKMSSNNAGIYKFNKKACTRAVLQSLYAMYCNAGLPQSNRGAAAAAAKLEISCIFRNPGVRT